MPFHHNKIAGQGRKHLALVFYDAQCQVIIHEAVIMVFSELLHICGSNVCSSTDNQQTPTDEICVCVFRKPSFHIYISMLIQLLQHPQAEWRPRMEIAEITHSSSSDQASKHVCQVRLSLIYAECSLSIRLWSLWMLFKVNWQWSVTHASMPAYVSLTDRRSFGQWWQGVTDM